MYLLQDWQKTAQQMEGNFLSYSNLNAKCFYATHVVFRSPVSSQASKTPLALCHSGFGNSANLQVNKEEEERKMYKSDFWI